MTTILFRVVAALRRYPLTLYLLQISNRMNSGYYFFTSAIGGQTPCWSPLSSAASVPPLTRAVAAYDAITTSGSVNGSDGDGGDDDPNEDDSTPTSAVNNVVFSVHYPVDSHDALSLGAYIGIALGISVTVSATFATILWFWLRRRKQKTARLRRAMQQADNDNYYPGIWDGPSHGSDEQLFQVPAQELTTFGQDGKPTAVDRMASRTGRTNSGYAAQQAQHFQQQTQQSFGFHAVGTHGHNSGGMNNDFTPGFPLAVHVPRRVSSAAAAAGGNSSLPPIPPISSTRSQLPLIKKDENAWGVDSKGGQGHVDSKGRKPKGGLNGRKEEEPLQNAGGASEGAAGSSSSHNGDQQQRQSQHPAAELEGHPVAVPGGHGSGYGLDEVEGNDEPPPEYREF